MAPLDSGDGRSAFLALFNRRILLKIAVGFVIAVVLLIFLADRVGWSETSALLRAAEARWVLFGAASTLLGLIAWGKVWQLMLAVGGVRVPYHRLAITYLAGTFANYITPLGQAGGEPFIAFVLSRDTEASYEHSLASVVTADLLNLLPFFTFAGVGLVMLVFQAGLPRMVRQLAMALTVVAIGVPLIVFLGWRFRERCARLVLILLTPIVRHTRWFSREGIRRRIEHFYADLDRIASDPRALVVSLVFAFLGWLLFVLPLWFAGKAIGVDIPITHVLVIVPLSTIAGMVPTPGGLGAVEGALVILLIAVVAVPDSTALALATLYRLMSYWVGVSIGGLATLWVIART